MKVYMIQYEDDLSHNEVYVSYNDYKLLEGLWKQVFDTNIRYMIVEDTVDKEESDEDDVDDDDDELINIDNNSLLFFYYSKEEHIECFREKIPKHYKGFIIFIGNNTEIVWTDYNYTIIEYNIRKDIYGFRCTVFIDALCKYLKNSDSFTGEDFYSFIQSQSADSLHLTIDHPSFNDYESIMLRYTKLHDYLILLQDKCSMIHTSELYYNKKNEIQLTIANEEIKKLKEKISALELELETNKVSSTTPIANKVIQNTNNFKRQLLLLGSRNKR